MKAVITLTDPTDPNLPKQEVEWDSNLVFSFSSSELNGFFRSLDETDVGWISRPIRVTLPDEVVAAFRASVLDTLRGAKVWVDGFTTVVDNYGSVLLGAQTLMVQLTTPGCLVPFTVMVALDPAALTALVESLIAQGQAQGVFGAGAHVVG